MSVETVSWKEPCKGCGEADWCFRTSEGWHHCHRGGGDGWREHRGAKGGITWIWHESGPSAPPPEMDTDAYRVPLASIEFRNTIYSGVLKFLEEHACPLLVVHEKALLARGLDSEHVKQARFFSYPSTHLAQEIIDSLRLYKDRLLGVPGFLRGDRVAFIQLRDHADALGIPVRDASGRIGAVRLRVENEDGEKKYFWLAAPRHADVLGCSPGAMCHVPLHGPELRTGVVRVTEGEIKAEIATARTNTLTISVPGVGLWPVAIETIQELKASRVLLAYDGDQRTNPAVATSLQALAGALYKMGLEVAIEVWDEKLGKGIDDVLVNPDGGPWAIELREGREAWEHIADACTSSGAFVDPCAKARVALDGIVQRAKERPGILLTDSVLEAFASLKTNDPEECANLEAELRKAKVAMRDFQAALRKVLRKAAKEEVKHRQEEACRPESKDFDSHYRTHSLYRMQTGNISWLDPESETGGVKPCAWFSAVILRELVQFDGIERTRAYEIQARVTKQIESTIVVPSADYRRMEWVDTQLGSSFALCAGTTAREHARAAIQVLSQPIPEEHVYTFTGWHRLNEEWVYLHRTGALGADGPVEGTQTRLEDPAHLFEIPDEGEVDDLRVCFDLMNTGGPDDVMLPLLCCVWRAVLGPTTAAVYLAGKGESGKSMLAGLAGAYFGKKQNAHNLPILLKGGTTQAAIGRARAVVGDAVFVVDDFMLTGDARADANINEMLESAARAQYSASGRKRLNSKTLRVVAEAPPRCLTVYTGEVPPPGHSLTSRLLILNVARGKFGDMKPWLDQASKGMLAAGMNAHIRWLAPQLEQIRKELPRLVREETELLGTELKSERIAEMAADLLAGLRVFLRHAVESGAVDGEDAAQLLTRARATMSQLCIGQVQAVQSRNPAVVFLEILRGGLRAGHFHLRRARGVEPPDRSGLLGWFAKSTSYGVDREAQGICIGYVSQNGKDVFISRDDALREARTLAQKQGEPLAVTGTVLADRLDEAGLLSAVDKAQGCRTVRRRIEGEPTGGLLSIAMKQFLLEAEADDEQQVPPPCGGDEPPNDTDDAQDF